ncbi:hypothetical protein LZP73_03195 [Shewanella sp. AS16]|uniref:hypothetical protein n=1 Tax=Shewanella sp. AS16 TaxID=2907625 RepID=UPI001F15BC7C|nr:hypothetical protein [Shewanella sp. AS16]MCE9685220.1 hypothetical protein [Shewanella sp. AS16]
MKSWLLALPLIGLGCTAAAHPLAYPASVGTSIDTQTAASQLCAPLDAEHLSARYLIKNEAGQSWQIRLLRKDHNLIVQRLAQADVQKQAGQQQLQSFESWTQDGEYVRYFPREKRSITYRKGDLRALNIQYDGDSLYHLVPSKLTTELEPGAQSRQGCFATQAYRGERHGASLDLAWIPALALPYGFSHHQGQDGLSYQLVDASPLSAAEFDAMIADYQDLDFADVGDSESDPFIAKMIHQGFIQHGGSGFYDSEGHPLDDGGHGH